MPWIIETDYFTNPATKGDNFRDNVEKIVIPNPVAGMTYTITVTHKGTLSFAQFQTKQKIGMIVTGNDHANCGTVTNFATSNITPTGVTISWSAVAGASEYEWQHTT